MGDPLASATPEGVPALSAAAGRARAANPELMTELVHSLHGDVDDGDSLLDLMGRTCRQALRVFPSVRWAGVTAEFDGRPFTITHTDERVLVIDERQYAVHDGPCLRAMRTDTQVVMSIEQARQEWPHLALAARRVGVTSFLAGPLRVGGRPVGALNLYSPVHDPQAIDADLLTVLTDYLDRGLTSFAATRPPSTTGSALREALMRSGLVEEAIGVLVERFGFDVDYARQTLVDQARAEQRTLSGQASRILSDAAGA